MPVIFKINVNRWHCNVCCLVIWSWFCIQCQIYGFDICLEFLIGLPEDLKEANKKGIVLYIDKFLKSPDPSFVHVALWTLNMLLKGKKPFNMRMKQLFYTPLNESIKKWRKITLFWWRILFFRSLFPKGFHRSQHWVCYWPGSNHSSTDQDPGTVHQCHW